MALQAVSWVPLRGGRSPAAAPSPRLHRALLGSARETLALAWALGTASLPCSRRVRPREGCIVLISRADEAHPSAGAEAAGLAGWCHPSCLRYQSPAPCRAAARPFPRAQPGARGRADSAHRVRSPARAHESLTPGPGQGPHCSRPAGSSPWPMGANIPWAGLAGFSLGLLLATQGSEALRFWGPGASPA